MTQIPPFAALNTHPSPRTLGELLGLPSAAHGTPDAGRSRGGREGRIPLPLVRVEARVRIVGDCAVTELTEHYRNGHDLPLDVTHLIPLPASGAVTGFTMRAGGRVTRGVCKDSAEARADFSSALERGKTAALVTQVRDDQHRIGLANVPPRTDVAVTLRIVERLRVDDGRFEYRLPTTVPVLHVPGSDVIGHDGPGWSPDTREAPDASHRTPPVLVGGTIPLDLEVRLASGATAIEPSIALDRTDEPDGTIVLRPATSASCDGDVVLRFWGRGERTTMRAYTDGERTLVVIDPPATRMRKLERVREAIFVLDHSGSMHGMPLAAAKAALAASIKGLSPTDRVQVIAFDTTHEAFPDAPVAATKANVRMVLAWLNRIEARGGTRAIPALQAACAAPQHPGHVRTVLFVTDGHVANDREILGLTRTFDPAVRLSAVGIGMGPQDAMLARLARMGGGTHLNVAGVPDEEEDEDDAETEEDEVRTDVRIVGERIEREIARFGATLLGPIAFGLHEAGSPAPSPHGAEGGTSVDLFAGRGATLFLEGARTAVRIESVDGAFRGECEVRPSPVPLGELWARQVIERLEDRRIAQPGEADAIDARIRELGIAHQVQTRLTSFVAVDEASQVHGAALEIEQPVQALRDSGIRASIAPSAGNLRMAPIARPRALMRPDAAGSQAGDRCEIHEPRRHRAPAPRQAPPPATRTSPKDRLRDDVQLALAGLELMSEDQYGPLLECLDADIGFLESGPKPDTDPLIVMLILVLMAFIRKSEERSGAPRIPSLAKHDFTTTGTLWTQCMQALKPMSRRKYWRDFITAARTGHPAAMYRTAVVVVGFE